MGTRNLTSLLKHSSAKRAGLRRQPVNYSFMLPATLFLLVFIAYPIAFNFRISFQDLRAINLLQGDAPWVGWQNYRAILGNPLYLQAVRQTLVFRWLFDGQVGVVNWPLQTLGLIEQNIYRLADLNFALPAVIVINIWLGIASNRALPFALVVLRPFFLSLPPQLTEAAKIDGCAVRGAFYPGDAAAGRSRHRHRHRRHLHLFVRLERPRVRPDHDRQRPLPACHGGVMNLYRLERH